MKNRAALVVLTGTLAMIAVNGFVYTGLTVFDTEVLKDLHIQIAELKLRDTITIYTFGTVILGSGYLIDRYPIRPIICTGLTLIAISLFAYSFVSTLWHIYALHVVLGIGQATSGIVSQCLLVTRWTEKYRNISIGLIIAGSSVGNATVPTLNAWLLAEYGWRNALALGSLVPALMAVMSWIVIRESDTVSPSASASAPAEAQGNAFSDALRSKNFILLSVIAAATVYSVNGISTNLALYVQREQHLTIETATKGLLMLFLVSIIGQLMAGSLSSRLSPVRIHVTSILVMAIGGFLLAINEPRLLLPSMFVFGLGWGGNSACLVILPALLFRTAYLGKILACIAITETFIGGLGPTITGFMFQKFGTYSMAFTFIAVACVLATLLTSFIRLRGGGLESGSKS